MNHRFRCSVRKSFQHPLPKRGNHLVGTDSLFTELAQLCEAEPGSWSVVSARFIWNIDEANVKRRWLLSFREHVEVRCLGADEPATSDCSLASSAETARQLLNGELSPQQAFLSNRLRMAGDTQAALRFATLLELWRATKDGTTRALLQ